MRRGRGGEERRGEERRGQRKRGVTEPHVDLPCLSNSNETSSLTWEHRASRAVVGSWQRSPMTEEVWRGTNSQPEGRKTASEE